MPSYEGKTDEVLHIKLPSSFLHAIWLSDGIAINGKAYLEVLMHWVGIGAPLKITFKDLEGKVLDTYETKVGARPFFQHLYTPSITNKTGGVIFEAELPAHKKKMVSGILRIGKPIEFSALRFTDFNSEKTLTEIMERVPVACEAKAKGVETGTKVLVSVYLRINSVANAALLVEAEVPVKDGKAILYFDPNIKNRIDRVKVQQELNKEYGTYLQPEYFFEVIAAGVVAKSEPAKAVQNMTMHFWEMPNVAGSLEGKKVTVIYPDGNKEEKVIPKDGNINFEKTMPGKHKVVLEDGVKVKSGKVGLNTTSNGKKYTDNPNEVITQRTKPDAREVIKLLQKEWPELTENGARTLTAQFMFETGGGGHCYNWNLGNVKASKQHGVEKPHMYLHGVWEIESAHDADLHVSKSNGQARIANAIERKKKGWSCPDGKVVVVYNPPHIEARFRAYASLEEGANLYIKKHKSISEKESEYITKLNNGQCDKAAHILKNANYYTLNESDYAKGWTKKKLKMDKELGPIS